ncbi:uncharacterized protein LOC126749334 [Anthonomus grandis grandis]|uniref:uncharacterized protein LOC126749334 n=1 Tax=Anthonomus grandis grandis TaxID=2921223 RepID=UPI00216606F5|nr:uncharacterized protein LOC126749334 [Anthonomus grandis grandis]
MGVVCKYCEKLFSSQSNINKHIKNVHKLKASAVSYDKAVWNSKCMESACNSSFQRNEDLVIHLRTEHNMFFETEDLFFTSKKEFAEWKTSMEEQYQCNYVISAKRNKGENTEIIYYKCNRSNINKVTIKEHRQRNLKSQGTCKLNFTCTSQIKVVYKSNKCSIHWIKTHYNHKAELEHIRLSSRMKNEIAAKLVSGLSDQRVLEINRDKIGEHLKRIDLLTSKDVDNIKVKYNIEAKYGKRHPNDALSVDLWVRECQSKPPHENMVLFYKKQGEDSEDFRKMDFCLIIMNSFQELMLKKFGNNVIAVDSTHILNNYDFEMSTVMMIDDFGEGVPVAFMFSNRKDTYVYHVFFKTIMTRVGKINARTFMSDLAESLYKAWCSIMGQVRYHLICSWHVDRAWQTNLSKIRFKDKRSEIYQILKVLQSEIDEVKFEKKLVSAINIRLDDDDTKIFGSYFQLNYLKNSGHIALENQQELTQI